MFLLPILAALAAGGPPPLVASVPAGFPAAPDQPGSATLALINLGDVPVRLLGGQLDPAGGFRLVLPVAATRVAPGASVEIGVAYTPPAPGAPGDGRLLLDTDRGVVEVPLRAGPAAGVLGAMSPEAKAQFDRDLAKALPGGLVGAKGTQLGTSTAGAPIVLGALDSEVVQAVVRPVLGEVQACADRAEPPAGAGRLVVKLVIGPDGTVTTSTVKSSTLASPSAETCVTTLLKGLHFPAPPGGGMVMVSYPFDLE